MIACSLDPTTTARSGISTSAKSVAEVLKEIGVFLELKGENPFKTRAYVNGARILEGLTESLDTLIEAER